MGMLLTTNPPPYNAEVKESVQLYIYPNSVPSWNFTRRNFYDLFREFEDAGITVCYTVSIVEKLPTFRKLLMPLSTDKHFGAGISF